MLCRFGFRRLQCVALAPTNERECCKNPNAWLSNVRVTKGKGENYGGMQAQDWQTKHENAD